MPKKVIHVSEADATNDFATILKRVRAGAEVVIEHESHPVAVVRGTERHLRLLFESLRLTKKHGSTATLDGAFERDLEAIVNSRRGALNPPAWD